MVDEIPQRLFIHSLEIDPDDCAARYYLAQVALARARLHLRADEFAEARAVLSEAIRYAPERPELHALLRQAGGE